MERTVAPGNKAQREGTVAGLRLPDRVGSSRALGNAGGVSPESRGGNATVLCHRGSAKKELPQMPVICYFSDKKCPKLCSLESQLFLKSNEAKEKALNEIIPT